MKTKNEIMHLLRIDDMQYAEAVEAFGLAYVSYYCADCPGAADHLTRTAAFWKWWKRHQDIRDEVFLATYATYTDAAVLNDVRNYWVDAHSREEIEGRIPGTAWREMLATLRVITPPAPEKTNIKPAECVALCNKYGWKASNWASLQAAFYLLKNSNNE